MTTLFSSSIPNWQLAWDSTSLGWFKTCSRLYQYHMLEQWTSRFTGLHLQFGLWYASGVELYARLRADGADHETAVRKMVKWAMNASGERAHSEGCPRHPLYCDGVGEIECCCAPKWTPWESGDSNKNRYTLIRTLIWNVDDREEKGTFVTHILPSGKPAVELSFNFAAFEIEGETISLCGHMDEVVEHQSQLWVKDDKTTKAELNARYFQQYSPDNQMSLYAIAGRVVLNRPVAGVLVRAAQILVNGSRFVTQPIPRPKSVLDEWMRETEQWVHLARRYAEQNFWPRNDKSCDKFGGCPFQKVCSASPVHRPSFLAADFIKREWNPTHARGD